VIENIGTLDAYDKYADIEAVLFLIRDVDHYFKVWKEDVGREILEKVGSNTGFRLMSLAFRGARYVTSKKKIESFMILKVSKYECLTLLFMLMHCKCLVLAIYQWPLPSCIRLCNREQLMLKKILLLKTGIVPFIMKYIRGRRIFPAVDVLNFQP